MKTLFALIILYSSNSFAFNTQLLIKRIFTPVSEILGEDKNNNGIRDEVENEILKKFKNPDKANMYLSKVKHYEKVYSLELNHENATEWWKKFDKNHACAYIISQYGLNEDFQLYLKDSRSMYELEHNNGARWLVYQIWKHRTHNYINTKSNMNQFEEIIFIEDICDFKLQDIERFTHNALFYFFKGRYTKVGALGLVEKLEKKYGTKHKKKYEKFINTFNGFTKRK